jgi:DNA-binding response OmpR family regulator
MSVLVVEDEKRVLTFLTEALRKEGYSVHGAETYEEAEQALQALGAEVEVIVMDRLLHRSDALSLITKAKRLCPVARILMLSAINDPSQKAAALDLGADDYLGKPFSLVELSARVRSLHRRASEAKPKVDPYVFAAKDLQVNALEHKVTVAGKPLDLSNKEYLLLLALIQHPGRVFNKFQLLDKVWDAQYDVESNVVEATVKNLRKKLAQAESKAEILSRRNIGYWIEA